MNRKVEYLNAENIVVARTSGSYALETEIETLKEVIALLNQHDCDKCIFDHRETIVIARTMGAFSRPGLYEELGMKRSVNMAIVAQELSDDLAFYENVCVNRGWKVRLFDNYNAALEWLATKTSVN